MPRIYTAEGLKKLKAELAERKVTLRQEIAQAIKEAKEQGDLSENAEYSEAKRRQNENETRIAELEAMLKEAVLAPPTNGDGNKVQVGSKIHVRSGGKELVFEVVGSNEVNPAQGKISNESPLGKEFIGKKRGDRVEVQAPVGKLKYDILAVE